METKWNQIGTEMEPDWNHNISKDKVIKNNVIKYNSREVVEDICLLLSSTSVFNSTLSLTLVDECPDKCPTSLVDKCPVQGYYMTPLKNPKNWHAIQENTLWWLFLSPIMGAGVVFKLV